MSAIKLASTKVVIITGLPRGVGALKGGSERWVFATWMVLSSPVALNHGKTIVVGHLRVELDSGLAALLQEGVGRLRADCALVQSGSCDEGTLSCMDQMVLPRTQS